MRSIFFNRIWSVFDIQTNINTIKGMSYSIKMLAGINVYIRVTRFFRNALTFKLLNFFVSLFLP